MGHCGLYAIDNTFLLNLRRKPNPRRSFRFFWVLVVTTLTQVCVFFPSLHLFFFHRNDLFFYFFCLFMRQVLTFSVCVDRWHLFMLEKKRAKYFFLPFEFFPHKSYMAKLGFCFGTGMSFIFFYSFVRFSFYFHFGVLCRICYLNLFLELIARM